MSDVQTERWCPEHGKHDGWSNRSDGLYGGESCDLCWDVDHVVVFPVLENVIRAIRGGL